MTSRSVAPCPPVVVDGGPGGGGSGGANGGIGWHHASLKYLGGVEGWTPKV